MPRFVILRHETPPASERPLHWDLMLEQGESLRTWALQAEPGPGCRVAAFALQNHRLHYLDYEGPLAGGRGVVSRFDHGDFTLLAESEQEILLRFTGRRLVGDARLWSDDPDGQNWTLAMTAAGLASP